MKTKTLLYTFSLIMLTILLSCCEAELQTSYNDQNHDFIEDVRTFKFSYKGSDYESEYYIENDEYIFMNDDFKKKYEELKQLPDRQTLVTHDGEIHYFDNLEELNNAIEESSLSITTRAQEHVIINAYVTLYSGYYNGRSITYELKTMGWESRYMYIPDLKIINMKDDMSSYVKKTYYHKSTVDSSVPGGALPRSVSITFYSGTNYSGWTDTYSTSRKTFFDSPGYAYGKLNEFVISQAPRTNPSTTWDNRVSSLILRLN